MTYWISFYCYLKTIEHGSCINIAIPLNVNGSLVSRLAVLLWVVSTVIISEYIIAILATNETHKYLLVLRRLLSYFNKFLSVMSYLSGYTQN
jgi:hypothetical protein